MNDDKTKNETSDSAPVEARRAFLKKAAKSSATAGAVTLLLSAGAKAGEEALMSPPR